MSTPKRLTTGERLKGLPGQTWDMFVDHIQSDHSNTILETFGLTVPQGIGVIVYSSTRFTRYSIVSVGSIYKDPNVTENESYKHQPPVFQISAPLSEPRAPGILVEPIKESGFGYVLLSGMTWADVSITDESHGYAEVSPGDSDKLVSADEPGLEIYWKPSGTGIKRCAIMLCGGELISDPAAPAPLGAAPTASGTYDDTTDIVLDGTASTPDSGLSLVSMEWIFTLPSTHALTISGPVGSVPNFVNDSRGTLDDTDIGTNITGNIEDLTIDTTAGSLSSPWNIDLIVTQNDGQQDEAVVVSV